MPKVQKSARLHHKTVTEHKKHTKKRTRKSPTPKNDKPVVIKVCPEVWEKAIYISGYDLKRIVVESETSVLVVNSPVRGKKRG